jgi:hypothetical protein
MVQTQRKLRSLSGLQLVFPSTSIPNGLLMSTDCYTGPVAFPILGLRLANLKDRMRTWRPRRKRDLLKVGYSDRFSYYTQLFALFIAAIGTVGVVLSIVQTAYAAIATNDNSVEMAVDRVEAQIAALLNVTKEIVLALQELRANGTA